MLVLWTVIRTTDGAHSPISKLLHHTDQVDTSSGGGRPVRGKKRGRGGDANGGGGGGDRGGDADSPEVQLVGVLRQLVGTQQASTHTHLIQQLKLLHEMLPTLDGERKAKYQKIIDEKEALLLNN